MFHWIDDVRSIKNLNFIISNDEIVNIDNDLDISSLLMAAEKYQMKDLCCLCMTRLLQNFSHQSISCNVADTRVVMRNLISVLNIWDRYGQSSWLKQFEKKILDLGVQLFDQFTDEETLQIPHNVVVKIAKAVKLKCCT